MSRLINLAFGPSGTRFPRVKAAVARGVLGGQCNRTACLTTGATWYNTATQRHYCTACARLINDFARTDSGNPLCFLVTPSLPNQQ